MVASREKMEFTKERFGAFREDVEKALKAVGEKYNVSVKAGRLRYSDVKFDLELNVQKADVDVEKEEFERLCPAFGFGPKHYKARFSDRGKTFEFYGFVPSGRASAPCLVRDVATGIGYKTRVDVMKINLGMVSREEEEKKEFSEFCAVYGFKPEDYGRPFTINGKEMSLIGFRPSADRAIVREKASGKSYLVAVDAVKRWIDSIPKA
jgi:hypothetical protein